MSPEIYDKESSPVGDWIPEYWENGTQEWMIEEIAENFVGNNLLTLNGDFFRDQDTAFRNAIKEVKGFDGVIQEFDNGITHYVAWFSNQIKSATNNNGEFDTKNNDIRFQINQSNKIKETENKVKEVYMNLQNPIDFVPLYSEKQSLEIEENLDNC